MSVWLKRPDRAVADADNHCYKYRRLRRILCYSAAEILHKRRMLVAGFHPYSALHRILRNTQRFPLLSPYRPDDVDSGPL